VPGLTCKPIEGIQAVHLHCGFVAPVIIINIIIIIIIIIII
jgi:hypothetical protein